MANLTPYTDYNQYNQSPFNTRFSGGGGIGQILMMMLGNKMYPLPQPNSTQSTYDALLQRQRDIELLQIRNNAIASNLVFKKLGGVNQASGLFQVGAGFINDPNGWFSKGMSPLLGGNPIQAQMDSFSKLRGLNMSAFGTGQNINNATLTRMQDTFYQNFYTQKTLTDLDRSASRDVILNKNKTQFDKNYLSSFFEKGTGLLAKDERGVTRKANLDNAIDMGDRISKQLASFDLTSQEGKVKARQAADEFLKQITDNTAKAKIESAITESIKNGTTKGFESKSGMENMRRLSNELTLHSTLVGKAPVAVNYANTYGFSMEDLTSARDAAIASRLVGTRKGLLGTVDALSQNKAVSTLDSMRSFFGNNRTGKQLTGDLDSFLGVSSIDLTDASQSGKLENLLRDIKALARNANVSIDVFKTIIEEGKLFAANSEGLKSFGGYEIGQMVLSAGTEAVAVANNMSSPALRRAGGTAGLLQNIVSGKLENADQPISRYLGALHEYYRNDPVAQSRIREYSEKGDKTSYGFNTFTANLAGQTGQQFYRLLSYATSNTAAQQAGLEAAPELASAGSKAKMQEFRFAVYNAGGGGQVGQRYLDAIDREASTKNVELDKYMEVAGQDTDQTSKNLALSLKTNLQRADLKAALGITDRDVTLEDFLSADSTIKQKFAVENRQAIALSERLRSRVLDRFDVAGNLISQGNDAFLNQNRLVSNNYRIDPRRYQSSPVAASLGLNTMAQDLTFTDISTWMRGRDAGFTGEESRTKQQIENDRNFEAMYARKTAHLNSPLTQQFLQQLMNGEVSKEGLSAFLKPLGIGTETSEKLTKMEEIRSAITAISGTKTTEDLANVLTNKGKSIDSESLGKLVFATGSLGIKPGQLKGIANRVKEGATIDAINSEINKDRSPKNHVSREFTRSLVHSIRNLDSSGLFSESYRGDYGLDSMKEYYQQGYLEEFKNKMIEPEINRLDTSINKELENLINGPSSDPTQAKYAKALIATLGTVDSKKLAELSREAGITQDENGQYKLTGTYKKIAEQLGIKDEGYTTYTNISKQIENLGGVGKYVKEAEGIRAAAEGITQGGDASLGKIEKILQDLVEKLPNELKRLVTAVGTLATN